MRDSLQCRRGAIWAWKRRIDQQSMQNSAASLASHRPFDKRSAAKAAGQFRHGRDRMMMLMCMALHGVVEMAATLRRPSLPKTSETKNMTMHVRTMVEPQGTSH